jgi:hypothetical protein
MGRQSGYIRAEGRNGKITSSGSKESYRLRRKGSIPADRIANDDEFKRTRENAAEFTRAGQAGKLLRQCLHQLVKHASDINMVARLTGVMMKVITADKISGRGFRNVTDGKVELLKGFDFNIHSRLTSTIRASFSAAIYRSSGKAKVDFSVFAPATLITSPNGATHFQFNAVGAAIDFEKQIFKIDSKSSRVISLLENLTTLQLVCQLPANSSDPLFLVLGIEFFQEVNAILYPLQNAAANSLAIVQVSSA